MKHVLLILFLALVAFPVAAGARCCVCSDGTCIETTTDMKSCIERCQTRESKSIAYNEQGKCWVGGCQRVREMHTEASRQKGGAR